MVSGWEIHYSFLSRVQNVHVYQELCLVFSVNIKSFLQVDTSWGTCGCDEALDTMWTCAPQARKHRQKLCTGKHLRGFVIKGVRVKSVSIGQEENVCVCASVWDVIVNTQVAPLERLLLQAPNGQRMLNPLKT